MDRIEADWLTSEATQRVFSLLAEHSCFAVGGCVRNTLLGVPVKDIDLATSARPEQVVALAEADGLKVVPTGIDHGTVTVIVDDVAFEITTFRRDVETDGRRAVIAFADGIEDDARRRDFTMNAIYVDATGVLFDPVSGLPDIVKRRVRFIEDADRRIQEDYLRSLRFFRFSAWYGDPDAGFDPEALDAIARNLGGLETLSRERVGSELLRLLSAPDPAPAVAVMRATGVLGAVLPGADDTGLAPLVALEALAGVEPEGLRRLAVLGGDLDMLRLSKRDRTRVETVRANVGTKGEIAGYREGWEVGQDIVLFSAALAGQPIAGDALEKVRHGAAMEFPITAKDLMPEFQGKALGEALSALEQKWIESGFTLSREALLRKG